MGSVEKNPRTMVPVDTAAAELCRQLDLLSGRAYREDKMDLANALRQCHQILKPAVKVEPPKPDPRQPDLPKLATAAPVPAQPPIVATHAKPGKRP